MSDEITVTVFFIGGQQLEMIYEKETWEEQARKIMKDKFQVITRYRKGHLINWNQVSHVAVKE